MALNATQLKNAIEKFKDLTGEELETAIKDNYNEENALQLLNAIKGAKDGPAPESKDESSKNPDPIDPVQEIIKELKAIDTSDGLKGKDCKRYYELLSQLDGNVHLTFEVKKVDVIRDKRHEGVEGSPIDIIGVSIKESKAINTTNIPVKHALQFIGRLEFPLRRDENYFNIVGSQINPGSPAVGRFYFVKK